MRAKNGSPGVTNTVWNGSKITLFGAKNEVVDFNLVLEAATTAASNVSVSFNTLTGPGGATISSIPATGNGVFNYTQRNIENFYVRYLQIKGLSLLSYEGAYYDERHVPQRLRRPWTGNGVANSGTTWANRPDHDKYYPDIAEPLELNPVFSIAQGKNQSIWSDIYIPKTVVSGLYTGTVTITENGNVSYAVPVELTVRNFTLPDVPTSKTMLNLDGGGDIAHRYTGVQWPNPTSPEGIKTLQLQDKHFQMAHRHKISLIGGDETNGNKPNNEWIPRLNGSLFTSANGYDGPGVNTGNNVYSIGTYGGWQSSWGTTQSGIQTHAAAWESWFEANFPNVDRFVYLVDESSNFTQTQQWASWVATATGSASKLPTMATLDVTNAEASVPALTVPTSGASFGITSQWTSAIATLRSDPTKKFMLYNGHRPAGPSWCTEDDGVALRMLSWVQYKEGVDRWFYWDSTYYNDYQTGISTPQTDVFNFAATFTGNVTQDSIKGETGYNHTNGDGVLFYPGTDKVYPASNLGVDGPLASLRLKQWRRGIQDVDYLALAKAINPAAVQTLVNQMVPKVLWELGVDNTSDPTYVHSNISWSIDPNVWEGARKQLADIIDPPLTLKKVVKKRAKLAQKKVVK